MANIGMLIVKYYAKNVTVFLEVYEEESRLEDCLKCFQWAAELVVFVKPSDDQTLHIARRWATHVYEVAYTNGNQEFYKNYQLHTSKPWCMFITASDLIDPELVQDIVQATDNIECVANAYALNYRMHVLGRCGRESPWYVERKVSLIAREQVELSSTLHREVGYKTNTRVVQLGRQTSGALHHFTHPNPNSLFEKHRRYTEVEAQQLLVARGEEGAIRQAIKELFRSIARVTIKQRTIFCGRWGLSMSLVYISYFIMKLVQVLHYSFYSDNPYEEHKKTILANWRHEADLDY